MLSQHRQHDLYLVNVGTLGAAGNLTVNAGNHLSSTMEADGTLNVAANQINNVRQNVQVNTVTVSDTTSTMTQSPWWTSLGPGSTPTRNGNTQMHDKYYLNPAAIIFRATGSGDTSPRGHPEPLHPPGCADDRARAINPSGERGVTTSDYLCNKTGAQTTRSDRKNDHTVYD
ncbi:hypothetical protein [Collimonas silvisoli]|uniref:hypothetical protein n=1 Tax=Collimonas silvisoli TaxID=2825884 RepID=UPI001B8D3CA5|nr:hypothetical protein [Collimonas silvisoli]